MHEATPSVPAMAVSTAMIAQGYKENTKILTRAQVKVIVEFLDPPY